MQFLPLCVSIFDSGKTMIIPFINKKKYGAAFRVALSQAHAAHLPLSQSLRGVGLSIFTRFLYTPRHGVMWQPSLKAPSLFGGGVDGENFLKGERGK
jgi:hypothetical protein